MVVAIRKRINALSGLRQVNEEPAYTPSCDSNTALHTKRAQDDLIQEHIFPGAAEVAAQALDIVMAEKGHAPKLLEEVQDNDYGNILEL